MGVARLLREAIKKRKWSVTDAAQEIGVRRSFLSRLLSGHRPPQELRGARAGAPPDERYQKIARRLGFDEEEFLSIVAYEQTAQSSMASRYRGLALPADVTMRYRGLGKIVAKRGPLTGETAFRGALRACLEARFSKAEADEWLGRISSPRRLCQWPLPSEYDHLGGALDSEPHSSYYADRKTCRRIAEKLTEGDGQKSADDPDVAARIDIAMLFLEMAHCLPDRESDP